jgi:hypothetical protein
MQRHLLLVSTVFAAAMTMAQAANAAALLSDDFDTGSVANNSDGVGGGFVVNVGDKASEVGSDVVLGGGRPIDENIYSASTFNPTDTQLTWKVDSRAFIGAAGAMVGWAPSGTQVCAGCGPEVWLEARDDRLVFDIVSNTTFNRYVGIGAGHGGYAGGSGPVTMVLDLGAHGWRFSVTGPGTNVNEHGFYVPGAALSDVLADGGGSLSTFASSRSDCSLCGDVSKFDWVTVTRISTLPEPGTMALFGAGALGLTALRRRKAKLA